MSNIIIRPALKSDCVEIRKLIQELADFQKLPDGPKIDAKALEIYGFENGLDGPLYEAFVAQMDNTNRLVGYSLYYYLYDCFEGRYLYLEDICVTESFRKHGIGAKLFKSVIQKALDENCSSVRWDVLKWNPAKKFYDKYGGIDTTETQGVVMYRIEKH